MLELVVIVFVFFSSKSLWSNRRRHRSVLRASSARRHLLSSPVLVTPSKADSEHCLVKFVSLYGSGRLFDTLSTVTFSL